MSVYILDVHLTQFHLAIVLGNIKIAAWKNGTGLLGYDNRWACLTFLDKKEKNLHKMGITKLQK